VEAIAMREFRCMRLVAVGTGTYLNVDELSPGPRAGLPEENLLTKLTFGSYHLDFLEDCSRPQPIAIPATLCASGSRPAPVAFVLHRTICWLDGRVCTSYRRHNKVPRIPPERKLLAQRRIHQN
jgi:hypothetical protein